MANYTYPTAAPEGSLTTAQTHLVLSNPRLLAKRIAELSKMKFIGDFLLPQRFEAKGGGIFYENGEEIFAADAPESVAPNSAYPKTVLTQGEISAAKTDKVGLETTITDEKISQRGFAVVRTGLQKLVNSVIRTVDSRALAVILSKVTSTFASPSTWTTAGKIVECLTSIAGTRADGGTGLDLDTVVLKPAQYAKVIGMLIDDKAFPREDGEIAIAGNLPVNALGFTWTTSPFWTSNDPYLVDREQLGGMADEDLESPDYVRVAGSNVETWSERNKRDGYDVRARRVVVPVVLEALAGVKITNTGL
jgi:hypothetical protein